MTRPKMKRDPDSWKRVIEDMLEEPEYQFARDTLEGIWDTIDNTGKVTAGQVEAIQNIRRSGL